MSEGVSEGVRGVCEGVLNAAPLAVSRLLVKHCDDAIVCNVSE